MAATVGGGETCAAGYKPTGDEWAAPVAKAIPAGRQRTDKPCRRTRRDRLTGQRKMSDIASELRERSLRAEQEGEPLALLDEAAAEIERLRSQPCPYVTGTVTRYCTLTPFTLTDAERESIRFAAVLYEQGGRQDDAATLRGLLERTRG